MRLSSSPHGPTPIPTRYHGVEFRSRLEARWAVFFEKMAYPWEYEPEGFEAPMVGRYLPDFIDAARSERFGT